MTLRTKNSRSRHGVPTVVEEPEAQDLFRVDLLGKEDVLDRRRVVKAESLGDTDRHTERTRRHAPVADGEVALPYLHHQRPFVSVDTVAHSLEVVVLRDRKVGVAELDVHTPEVVAAGEVLEHTSSTPVE